MLSFKTKMGIHWNKYYCTNPVQTFRSEQGRMQPALTVGVIMIMEGGCIIFLYNPMLSFLSLLNDPSVNQARSQML